MKLPNFVKKGKSSFRAIPINETTILFHDKEMLSLNHSFLPKSKKGIKQNLNRSKIFFKNLHLKDFPFNSLSNFQNFIELNQNRIDLLKKNLKDVGYIADDFLCVHIILADIMDKPILIEGEAGVGKTLLAVSIGHILAKKSKKSFDDHFIRLQCVEGLTKNDVLYDYDFQKQFLYIQSETEKEWNKLSRNIYSEEFLIERPLLRFLRKDNDCVLLIDEIDKSDPELEETLLEFLGELQISIPEYKTIKLNENNNPIIILTSNATRDMSDALLRRCLFLYIDFPSLNQQLEIIKSNLNEIAFDEEIGHQVCALVSAIRSKKLKKPPSTSELIDYYKTLISLNIRNIDSKQFELTKGILLKNQRDFSSLRFNDIKHTFERNILHFKTKEITKEGVLENEDLEQEEKEEVWDVINAELEEQKIRDDQMKVETEKKEAQEEIEKDFFKDLDI